LALFVLGRKRFGFYINIRCIDDFTIIFMSVAFFALNETTFWENRKICWTKCRPNAIGHQKSRRHTETRKRAHCVIKSIWIRRKNDLRSPCFILISFRYVSLVISYDGRTEFVVSEPPTYIKWNVLWKTWTRLC